MLHNKHQEKLPLTDAFESCTFCRNKKVAFTKKSLQNLFSTFSFPCACVAWLPATQCTLLQYVPLSVKYDKNLMSLNYLVPLVKCVLSWKINLAFFKKTTNCLPIFICRYIFSQQRFCDNTQYICCFDAFIENTCLQT